jgi:hypothetical protein
LAVVALYYMTLDGSAPDLSQVMSATGEKAFEMAFILASCRPARPCRDRPNPLTGWLA